MYRAHCAIIFAIAQLSCFTCDRSLTYVGRERHQALALSYTAGAFRNVIGARVSFPRLVQTSLSDLFKYVIFDQILGHRVTRHVQQRGSMLAKCENNQGCISHISDRREGTVSDS